MQTFFYRLFQTGPAHRRAFITASVMAGSLMLSACGGGSNTSSNNGNTSSSTPVVSQQDAERFLEQSSFGPTPAEVARVQSMGIAAYIDEQLKQPATGYTGFSYMPPQPLANCTYSASDPTSTASLCHRDAYTPFQVRRQFFINALNGHDQLRQRVAYALSQIMVVSGNVINNAYGLADYQNMLLKDAFGNYRQLLQDVTLSPVMGRYLDMVNNRATASTSPNENYAREVLQLFSIGVNKLNLDGTLQLKNGNPIPTYDQNVILGYSALFTGWTYPPLPGATSTWPNPQNYDGQMVLNDNYHDASSKLIQDGLPKLPAGQTGEVDLKEGLDAIFNNPNVPPFICKRLIQHLVTSNPTPDYVRRIAMVFQDNGQGVRGDLGAVVKAILLDPEARDDTGTNTNFGYLRDPALFLTTFMRNLGGKSDGEYLANAASAMGEPIFTPGSVFNFFPPDYHINVNNLEGPEFGILSAPTAITRANFLYQMIYNGGVPADSNVAGSFGSFVDLSSLAADASDANMLVDAVDQLLHSQLSDAAKSIVVNAVNSIDAANLTARVQMAVYLISTSQQYQVVH